MIEIGYLQALTNEHSHLIPIGTNLPRAACHERRLLANRATYN